MGNQLRSSAFALLALLLYGTVILLTAFAGMLSYKEYQLKQKTLGIETVAPSIPSPSPIPSVTHTPTPVKTIKNNDPFIDCKMSPECGGEVKRIKKSECSNGTCCQIESRWVWNSSKDKCIQEQNANLVDCVIAGKTYRITKDLCAKNTGGVSGTSYTSPYYSCKLCYHYPSGDNCTTYNYLVKSKPECDAEQSKIDTLGNTYVIPTNSPTQTITNTNSSSACYDQYNSDIQTARTYGGNVGTAMEDIAKTYLDRCLQTGNVTAVGPVQQDTRPRDRDGKLCSDYPPELKSYSQSMGCP